MFTIKDEVQNPEGISATDISYGDGTVAEAIAKKQDAETGKGLSTNDYTNDEKAKLAALPTNAVAIDGQVYTDAVIADGGNAQTFQINVDNKDDSVYDKQAFNISKDGLIKYSRRKSDGQWVSDATFMTDAALQSALDGKQAAGKYAVYNGSGQVGASISTLTNERVQIVAGRNDESWMLFQIAAQAKQLSIITKDATGDPVTRATFTADEDTGWQNAINTMVPIKSRKKNGMVTVAIYSAITQAMAANNNHTVGTLVAGHKPDTSIAFMANCKDTLFYRGYVDQNGKVGIVTQGTALAVGDTIRATVSFPV